MSTIVIQKVDNWKSYLSHIGELVVGGEDLSFSQAETLSHIPDNLIPDLAKTADKVRRAFTKEKMDLCSIVNARSGSCSQDCSFCAQSGHYKTASPVFPMKSTGEIVKAAKNAEASGAHRFCIVTSGESLSDDDFSIVIKAIGQIKRETDPQRCASIGSLSDDRVKRLSEAGLNRYHHNVETAESFFPVVCTTHTYAEKLSTIESLEKAGIEKCVGGILNLGETPKQRLEFIFELRKIDPVSVPINFLDPRPGTPLAGRQPISAVEAVKYLAIFRLVLPGTFIRLAGGRLTTFDDRPDLPFTSGVNALLIGDLLTTKGQKVNNDLELLKSLGFSLEE